MDIESGTDLLFFALEKEEEHLIFLRWIQDAHNAMSFDDYKTALQPKIPRADEDVFNDVGNILASFEAGR